MARPKKVSEYQEVKEGKELVVPEGYVAVKQAKLAVSVPGSTTQTLMPDKWELLFHLEKQVLHVRKLETDGKKADTFVIFPPNIAYLVM